MDIPGEKLLIKMWESLVDNGIGALLTPWHAQRQARVQLENRRQEMLLMAQTEREANDIRSGRKTAILLNGHSVKLLTNSDAVDVASGRIEPVLNIESIAQAALTNQQSRALKEEMNIANTILQTEEILRDESIAPSSQTIDADWLHRWRENAASVSSTELQSLWAKVLAGEVKSPGGCSLRAMDFLRNLTKVEAEDIQFLCPYLINGEYILVYGSRERNPDVGIGYELRMQELGLISGVEAALTLTFKSKTKVATGELVRVFRSMKHEIFVFSTKKSSNLTLKVHRVTALGMQVLGLNPMPAPEEYLKAIAAEVERQGFRADIVEIVEASGTRQT